MAGQSKSIDVSYEQLSTGKFVRTTNDLSISTKSLSGETETVLLKDYFLTSPDLVTAKGSTLKGDLVNLLAINSQPSDHGMVAFEDPQAIGKITTSDGAVSVQRLDQTIQLNEGDFIYLNDVVKSNTSAVGIAFADETTMSVDPNSTMVIDDFVYDPENPTTGSMNANILEGNFSFVSGQIAKTGADAMKVTTPVLTIGVRGTQVAGKANTDGEENEIVLLPNEDGSVGQVMIKNDSGEVLLTEAYQATIITDPYTVPTVPVILSKDVVLKKFAKTIATTKKTEAKAEVERETEEAAKEKAEAEKEGEELEEEKEELEEEKEQLEEEAEELEEKSEELEEEAEELEGEAEELDEKEEKVLEEKEEKQKAKEQKEKEIEELEEQLEDIPVEEREMIEQELQQLEEEFQEIEEEVQQIEQEIEVVAQEKAVVEQKVQDIEKEFAEVQEDFAEIEAKVEFVEKEVLQVIEKELIVEQKVLAVEQRFEAIVQNFEKFQEQFVQEFENFIPADELQQFIDESPQDMILDVQENVMEEFNEVNEEPQDIVEEEPKDIFAEENVEEQMQELENNEEFQELEEMVDEDNMMINLDNGEIVNPEDGPGFNEDNDVFNVDEENQVDDQAVEQLLQEEKEKALMEEPIAQEMDDFFQEVDPDNEVIDQQVQDMVVVQAQYIDEWFDGAGAGINDADDFYALEDDGYWDVIDNNEDAYHDSLEADAIMDQFIWDLAEEQDVNVAPWLDMPNAVTVNENLAVDETLGYVYGSDANNDQLTFSIFDDPTGKLKIVGNRITLDSAFSVTEDTTYSILLKVQDPYGASDIDSWQIVVENNHSPVISNTSAVSLAENVSTGTSVATVSASDAESETITYSITAGNTGNAFTINSSTGAITTAAALDYETTTSYTLTITATDSFGNATTTTQTVNVTDVNEVSNDPSAWVTTGDGSAGAYKQKIAYVGSGDGAGMITELGHTAEAYNVNNLDTYDVIAYYNSSNSQFYNSPFSHLSTALTSWVDDGGVLAVYDRWVNDAGLDTNLPGHNGNVVTTRGTSKTYNIVDESTSNLLKYGPGGIHIDGSSGYTHAGNNHLGEFHIGGGGHTNHGYMSNLDSDVLGLATRDNSNEYIDAVWSYGSGAVYYSTTPLDAYIGGDFAENDPWDAYALNSLHYATSMIFDGYSVLNGTSSADRMYGTTGNDTFAPGTGSDEIWTGNGSDVIKYTALNQSDLTGDNDVILDYTIGSDSIDISAITNGASISRTLVNNTLFKIDYNNDGTYDMQWDLDDYTGTADQVTVVT